MALPERPRLRAIEVFPTEHEGQRLLVVHDPTGMSTGTIAVSAPALLLMSLMDGQHTREQIAAGFAAQMRETVTLDQLDSMIAQLDAARFLDTDTFRQHLEGLVTAYRDAPARISAPHVSYGTDGEGVGPTIARMLSACQAVSTGPPGRRIAGLIAPHLDYPRGSPCYADAYGLLATAPRPRRFVLLGTNHFGRATSVCATRKDFQTTLGTTRTDGGFLERLEARCGVELCQHEFDHQREHSVELQLLVLQHLFGPESFEIVPILCHDPCGPTGTAPYDGIGVDLRAFAHALRDVIADDPHETTVIAGADLSHVGRRFGDDCELDEPFLSGVARHDRQAIERIVAAQPDDFVRALTARENETRVCSAGCIYALMTSLPQAEPELLRYHQAVDAPQDTCVTCCATVFWER